MSAAHAAVLMGLLKFCHAISIGGSRTGHGPRSPGEITSDAPRSPGPESSKAEITEHPNNLADSMIDGQRDFINKTTNISIYFDLLFYLVFIFLIFALFYPLEDICFADPGEIFSTFPVTV